MNTLLRHRRRLLQLWGMALALVLLAALGALAFQSVVASNAAHEEVRAAQRMLTAIWRLRAAVAVIRADGLAQADTWPDPDDAASRPDHASHRELEELLAETARHPALLDLMARVHAAVESQHDVAGTQTPDTRLVEQAWRRSERELDAMRTVANAEMDAHLVAYQSASRHSVLMAGGLGLVLSVMLLGAGLVILARLRIERRMSAALMQERSQLEDDIERLRVLSATDALTGLPNRRTLLEVLTAQLDRSLALKRPLSVLMIDVDRFKKYNDEYGHAAGDAALQGIAAALRSVVRESDLVARYGGEEFVVVLPGCDGRGAMRLASRLVERVRTSAVDAGSLTISAGVATLCRSVNSAGTMIERADHAMYAAKAAGGDTASTWRPVAKPRTALSKCVSAVKPRSSREYPGPGRPESAAGGR